MQKKHTYEDRLKYMKLLEAGYSVKHITSHYGISHHLIDVLWEKYQTEGPSGLIKKQYLRSDGSYREVVLRDIENNCLTLSEAAIKYDVSISRILFWKQKVRASGAALDACLDCGQDVSCREHQTGQGKVRPED